MEDEDQIQIKNGSRLLTTPIRGEIEFKNVSFEYKRGNKEFSKMLALVSNKEKKLVWLGTQDVESRRYSVCFWAFIVP